MLNIRLYNSGARITRCEVFHKVPLFLFLLLLLGCEKNDSSFFGQLYHNISAYFNTYYHAEKLLNHAIEAITVQQDYSEQSPLDILFQVPSNISTAEFKMVELKAITILQRHPKSDWVDNTLLLLGKALYFQKSYLSADKRFKEIIVNYANGDVYDEALEWYARSLVAQGLTVEAAYALQTLIHYPNAKNERKALGYFLLAELSIFPFTSYGSSSASVSANKELKTGLSRLEYEKAVSHIESGILLKYNDEVKARAYFVLGRIYDKLDLNQAAREAYEKCSQIAINDQLRFSGKLGAAKNFYYEKKYDMALAEYHAILNSGKYEPVSGKIRSEIAKVYLANGNPNKAIQTYIEIVQRNPKTEEAMNSFYQLGLYKEKVFQDYKGAQALYDSALASFSFGENSELLKLASKRVDSFLQDFDSFQILAKMILLKSKTLVTPQASMPSSNIEVVVSQRRRFQYRASETEKFISNGGKDVFVDFVNQTVTVRKKISFLPPKDSSEFFNYQVLMLNLSAKIGIFFHLDAALPDSALVWYNKSISLFESFTVGHKLPTSILSQMQSIHSNLLFSLASLLRENFPSSSHINKIEQEIILLYPTSKYAFFLKNQNGQTSNPKLFFKPHEFLFELGYIQNAAKKNEPAFIAMLMIIKNFRDSLIAQKALFLLSSWYLEFNNKPASLILYALAVLAYPDSPLSKVFSNRILFYLNYASQNPLTPASMPQKRLPPYPLSFSGFNVDSTNISFLKNVDSAFTSERFKQNMFAVLSKTPPPDTLIQFIKRKPLYKIILESKEITSMLNFNESDLSRFFSQTDFLQKDITSLIKEAILTCSKNEGRF